MLPIKYIISAYHILNKAIQLIESKFDIGISHTFLFQLSLRLKLVLLIYEKITWIYMLNIFSLIIGCRGWNHVLFQNFSLYSNFECEAIRQI